MVLEGDRQFDVAVHYPKNYRDTVPTATGGSTDAYIPLRELATINVDTGGWLCKLPRVAQR